MATRCRSRRQDERPYRLERQSRNVGQVCNLSGQDTILSYQDVRKPVLPRRAQGAQNQQTKTLTASLTFLSSNKERENHDDVDDSSSGSRLG